MSSPLLFARDGRTLPFIPVTLDALSAIQSNTPRRRLAYARSLYLALLEIANDRRAARVPISRRLLSERSGCSPELITDLGPVLEDAGVLRVVRRTHAGEKLENEWVIVEPNEAPQKEPETPHEEMPLNRGVLPPRQEGAASQAALTLEKEEITTGVKPPTPPKTGLQDPAIERVWDVYDELVLKPNRMRRVLDLATRRLIKTALEVRTLEDLFLAIKGLSVSSHHNGKNDQRKKYLDLRYALKGTGRSETVEQRIDSMIEYATKAKPKVDWTAKTDRGNSMQEGSF